MVEVEEAGHRDLYLVVGQVGERGLQQIRNVLLQQKLLLGENGKFFAIFSSVCPY